MPMNPRLLRPRQTLHPEAANWASRVRANGGSVSGSTLNAVSRFCASIAAAGIRDRFFRLNLFCGNSLSAALVPVFRGQSLGGTQFGNATDTNVNFVSGDYAETGASGGLQGSGTGKGLITGVNNIDIPVANHCAAYVSSRNTSVSNCMDVGASNSHTNDNAVGLLAIEFPPMGYMLASFQRVNLPYTGVQGTNYFSAFYIGCCYTDTNTMFRNGVAVSWGTRATGVRTPYSPSPLLVFASSQAGTTAFNRTSPARLNAYSVGLDLSSTQAAAYHNAMQAFQTALGRNV